MKLLLFSFLVASFVALNSAATRKLNVTLLHPTEADCNGSSIPEDACSTVTVVHVLAARTTPKELDLHYLFSPQFQPTMLVFASRNVSAIPSVDWSAFLSNSTKCNANSIMLEPPAEYAYSTVYSNLIEFNDVKGTGDMSEYDTSDPAYFRIHSLQHLVWEPLPHQLEEDSFLLHFKANLTNGTLGGRHESNMRIRFQVFATDDRAKSLPRLLHSRNSSEVELILDNLNTTFKSSRFGVEMVALSDSVPCSQELSTRNTVDDEYTPGVFHLVDWVVGTHHTHTGSPESAYLQYKPVAYFDADQSQKNSSSIIHYPQRYFNYSALSHNLASCYYGPNFAQEAKVIVAMNVTFGGSNVEPYPRMRYTSWTVLVGYGTPQEDSISVRVLVILICGLGAPALILLFTLAHRIFTKMRRPAPPSEGPYESINTAVGDL